MSRPLTIARVEGADHVFLGPRAAAAAYSRRHVNQVRRHCEPIACDVKTHAHLYDLVAVADHLAGLTRRYRGLA